MGVVERQAFMMVEHKGEDTYGFKTSGNSCMAPILLTTFP